MTAVILLTVSVVFVIIAVLAWVNLRKQLLMDQTAHTTTVIFLGSGLSACLTGFYGIMVWAFY